MSASGQMRGKLKAFSSICGVRLSKGSTDGPSPQRDVLLRALCSSTHLTGQVCAEDLARRGLGLGYCGFAWSQDMGGRSHDMLKFLIEHSRQKSWTLTQCQNKDKSCPAHGHMRVPALSVGGQAKPRDLGIKKAGYL